MTEHLETPLTHRLIESPFGRLLYLSLVERLKVGAIASEFTVLPAPDTPGIDPERIYPVGGLTDEMTQYQPTKAVFEDWGVPATNFTEWNCGHFDVLLRVMRTREFQHLPTNLLDEPRLSSGVTASRESR
jgi:hypothetical protein